jgi:hypothetical protein
MEAVERVLGDDVPQVAVFDTAFHANLPPAAYAYAGPHEWLDAGLRRFGFHGINHEYVAHRAAHLLGRDLSELRLISCHLGNGCSLAAVRGGSAASTRRWASPASSRTRPPSVPRRSRRSRSSASRSIPAATPRRRPTPASAHAAPRSAC